MEPILYESGSPFVYYTRSKSDKPERNIVYTEPKVSDTRSKHTHISDIRFYIDDSVGTTDHNIIVYIIVLLFGPHNFELIDLCETYYR